MQLKNKLMSTTTEVYDYVVIGSGFGGSVSALRLAEKGYKVLVLEKGRWFKAKDFPKTNWNLPRWLWLPSLRFFGFFKMTFFRHIGILSGVGVGGGSLVYGNTLPVPKETFFNSGNWKDLLDWETTLRPFYNKALKMLGATPNPRLEVGDEVLRQISREVGQEEHFGPTKVAIYFGEPGKTVNDPYFNGNGPQRAGCTFCGGCMTGCRYNAKNTLDKNYLHLAQALGVKIKAESEVYDVLPLDQQDGSTGYEVKFKSSTKFFGAKHSVKAKGVVFSGGVLGTVKLLLKLKQKSLPNLSDQLGRFIRTNNESLIGVTALDKQKDFSKGIAIGSILHTDKHSHLEPVRYSAGSGIWRFGMTPLTEGDHIFQRFFRIVLDLIRHPWQNLKAAFVDDWSKRTQILLFMQHLDSSLRFSPGWFGLKSSVDEGEPPKAYVPRAAELARQFSSKVNGKPFVLISESLLGIPSTAHILGGAVMGATREDGVINKNNQVFGYQNMMVCDGSMISANPGVNPSLSITAISERAMSLIPEKGL